MITDYLIKISLLTWGARWEEEHHRIRVWFSFVELPCARESLYISYFWFLDLILVHFTLPQWINDSWIIRYRRSSAIDMLFLWITIFITSEIQFTRTHRFTQEAGCVWRRRVLSLVALITHLIRQFSLMEIHFFFCFRTHHNLKEFKFVSN